MRNFLEKIIKNEKLHKTDLIVLLHLINKADNNFEDVITINQKEIALEINQYQPAISKSIKNLADAGLIKYHKHEISFLFDIEGNLNQKRS